DGAPVADATVPVHVAPRAAATVVLPTEVGTPGEAAAELVTATLDGVRGLWFFAEPRDSALVTPAHSGSGLVEAEVRPVEGGYVVDVTARHLVRDLTLLADKAHPDARVDAMLVTLLPG